MWNNFASLLFLKNLFIFALIERHNITGKVYILELSEKLQ